MCSFEAGFNGPIPIFTGVARVNRHSAEYVVPLEAGEGVYLTELLTVEPDGEVTVESTPGGRTFMTNEEQRAVRVQVHSDGRSEERMIDAGGVIVIRG